MKKKFALICVLPVCFTFFFTACSNINTKETLPDVFVGSEFEVTTQTFPSGFDLSYKISSRSGIEYVSEKANNLGVGAAQLTYTFKAVKAGKYRIKFKAYAAWAKTTTHIVTIKVVI